MPSIARRMTRLSLFIPTGRFGKPFPNPIRGEIDAVLLLFFVVLFQLFIGVSLLRIAEAQRDSLQRLAESEEDPEIETLHVFGDLFPAPLPRVDYGAYHQKNRDAEALCLIVQKSSFESKNLKFDCD